jgi:BirA family biotin operon repressor/biotin-[acetyl-CoA-carboxylase] ligase
LEIIFLNKTDSTQKEIKRFLDKKKSPPFCIVSKIQTDGIGSRGNSWVGKEGNLFFSFVLNKDCLPKDLPLASSSIYFGFLFKETLYSFGSKVWLKWPNDLYIDNNKIGGIITQKIGKNLICGIGLNLIRVDNFDCLDIKIDTKKVLNIFFKTIKNNYPWQEVFSKFSVEFQKSKNFNFHLNNEKISLKDAKLNSDGSLSINNKKVYNLR